MCVQVTCKHVLTHKLSHYFFDIIILKYFIRSIAILLPTPRTKPYEYLVNGLVVVIIGSPGTLKETS